MMVAPGTGSRSRLRALSGRAGWGLADQAFSSLTNFVLGVFVARSVGIREFGMFGLAFAAYSVAMGITRAVAGEPFGVRYSTCPTDEWRRGARDSMGAVLAIGVAVGLICVVAGLFLGGTVRAVLLALGLAMPFLMVQDGWRYIFFASGESKRAFVNDLVWSLLLIPSFAIVILSGVESAWSFVVAWAAAAAVAAVVGCFQARLVPLPTRFLTWCRGERDLIPGFLGDFAVRNGTQRATVFLVAAIAGLAATGALRGADMLLGPVTILFMGVNPIAVPEAARLIKRRPARLPRAMALLSCVLSASAVLLGAALLLLPDWIGRTLLSDTWEPAREVVFWLSLALAASAANTGAMIGMRALGDSKRMFRTRLVAAPTILVGVVIGASVGGAAGAAIGNAAATSLTDLVWWRRFRESFNERAGKPVEEGSKISHRLVADQIANSQ